MKLLTKLHIMTDVLLNFKRTSSVICNYVTVLHISSLSTYMYSNIVNNKIP